MTSFTYRFITIWMLYGVTKFAMTMGYCFVGVLHVLGVLGAWATEYQGFCLSGGWWMVRWNKVAHKVAALGGKQNLTT